VPKDCTFEFEFRCIGSDDPKVLFAEIERYARKILEPEMQAIDPASSIEFEELSAIDGLDMDPGEEVVTLAKTLAGRNDHAKVAFGTEAGLFQQQVGIPTVVCGPGSINQAHKPNEYLALEQLDRAHVFFDKLMDHVCK
jgi:acetylornithine deacetylase